MYGICHQSVEDFIIQRYGQVTWDEVAERAGVDGDFELDSYYDDVESVRVFTALGEVVSDDIEKVTYEYGQYWINYSSHTDFGKYLVGMPTLPLMIESLNSMHARLKAVLPQMKPPDFSIETVDAQTFIVTASTQRPSSNALIEGLLIELGRHFGHDLKLKPLAPVTASVEGIESHCFEVTLNRVAAPLTSSSYVSTERPPGVQQH